MKLGTSVIPHFHVILTKQSIFELILFIRGNLQGQRLFSKTSKKKKILTIKLGMYVIPLFHGILTEKVELWHCFANSRSSSRSISHTNMTNSIILDIHICIKIYFVYIK